MEEVVLLDRDADGFFEVELVTRVMVVDLNDVKLTAEGVVLLNTDEDSFEDELVTRVRVVDLNVVELTAEEDDTEVMATKLVVRLYAGPVVDVGAAVSKKNTFNLFGPPQFSAELPLQVMVQMASPSDAGPPPFPTSFALQHSPEYSRPAYL